MTGESPEPETAALQRQRALARWDNEGGAIASGSPLERGSADQTLSMPAVTDRLVVALVFEVHLGVPAAVCRS